MNGNEIAEEILNTIPNIMEEVYNTLIPDNIQIWLENNYKLIGLFFISVLIMSLNFIIIKELNNKTNKNN